MLWIKIEGTDDVLRHRCSNCNVLLLTVEGFALPTKCPACGATEGGADDGR